MTDTGLARTRALKQTILDRFYAGLNDMQRQAVETLSGPVLILAGAGSGKTTVLIKRIANLLTFGLAGEHPDQVPQLTGAQLEILEQCAKDGSGFEAAAELLAVDRPRPWNILAITFTNKAAGELRERLSAMLGPVGEDVHAATFHSACVRILRAEIGALGYPSSFTIYDTDDSIRVIKECMGLLRIDEKAFSPKALLGIISSAKDQMLTPAELVEQSRDNYPAQVAGQVFQLYQKRLKDSGAVDFDDIILLTVRLFQQFPEVLDKYRRRYRYIMVDEYQDTNHAQYLLVSLLAGGHKNICVVGDDDQSIYKFRGATIENIMSFESQFSGAKVIRLEQNYRCTGKILEAANHIISHNLQRKGKTLWTKNPTGENVQFYKGVDEGQEAAFIAGVIRDDAKGGMPYRDHAILYRMNAQSRTIEQTLVRFGIPYRIIGGLRFFERKEVKDVMAYLSVLNNPADALRLRRIVNEPKRGVGDATVAAAMEIADTLGLSLFEVFLTADQYAPLSKKAKTLVEFAAMMRGVADGQEDRPLIDTLELLLDQSGYVKALEDKNDFESKGRLENVEELKTTVLKYMEETEEPTLSGFLEEIALYTDLDNYDPSDDAVVMMTLHSAKGLEFPVVFIAGVEEGLFPGVQSIYNPPEIEEERRLAYVGVTRAKERLYLTTAGQRMIFGRTAYNRPSRFVGEIPPELLDEQDDTVRGRMSLGAQAGGYGAKTPGGSGAARRPAPQSPAADEPFTLKTGDRIRHRVFGEGLVTGIKPMGGDHMVEVAFDKVGTKRIMATYAKLEKMD